MKYIKKFFKAWGRLGMKIGSYVSFTLLLILYFTLFAPLGIAATLLFKKNRRRKKESYWLTYDKMDDTLHEQQF